jgi:hypothetical protein
MYPLYIIRRDIMKKNTVRIGILLLVLTFSVITLASFPTDDAVIVNTEERVQSEQATVQQSATEEVIKGPWENAVKIYGNTTHSLSFSDSFSEKWFELEPVTEGKSVILTISCDDQAATGGQASKATPTAAVAKFAASGKKVKKKDLGMMAMSYGYVYVAQVAMGADQNQFIKAVKEAEEYDGPSLIIAYAPCINHGIRTGMGTTQLQAKKAVEAGYWHLYRYNPKLAEEGKNPFILDSKEPTGSFKDFLATETRYTSLKVTFPDHAEELFEKTEQDAKERYETYRKKAE